MGVHSRTKDSIPTLWAMFYIPFSVYWAWDGINIDISGVIRVQSSCSSLFFFRNLWEVTLASILISPSFTWPFTAWNNCACYACTMITRLHTSSCSFEISLIIIRLQWTKSLIQWEIISWLKGWQLNYKMSYFASQIKVFVCLQDANFQQI